jgi:hypothetical protein
MPPAPFALPYADAMRPQFEGDLERPDLPHYLVHMDIRGARGRERAEAHQVVWPVARHKMRIVLRQLAIILSFCVRFSGATYRKLDKIEIFRTGHS